MADKLPFTGLAGPDIGPDDLLAQAMAQMTSSTTNTTTHTSTPALPPSLASMKGKTGAEILSDLNKTPLFMTELEENDELEAFKALAYEGTPHEVALGFKEHGNECFGLKQWIDAKEFFTKAIVVLQAEVRKRERGGRLGGIEGEKSATFEREEVRKEMSVLEACLCNRAATHLRLRNFRSAALDCASTIRINSRNIKAWYRSSTALLAMSRIKDADECCARGLGIDPENKDLLTIAQQIITRNEEIATKAKKELEAEQRKIKIRTTLRAALKAREIKCRSTAQPPEMEDARVELQPDPEDPTSTLVFPTVFLYPVHLQSDFVKAVNELEPIGERLQYILEEPMVWDQEREYTHKNVECYMETVTGGLVKLGKNINLLKVLSGGKIEVVDDIVKVFVVPKNKSAAWIKEFKAKKAELVT